MDIHDYGDRIVAALSGVGRRRAFSSIVAGLDNFEACKYLLASLQLVSLQRDINGTVTVCISISFTCSLTRLSPSG